MAGADGGAGPGTGPGSGLPSPPVMTLSFPPIAAEHPLHHTQRDCAKIDRFSTNPPVIRRGPFKRAGRSSSLYGFSPRPPSGLQIQRTPAASRKNPRDGAADGHVGLAQKVAALFFGSPGMRMPSGSGFGSPWLAQPRRK